MTLEELVAKVPTAFQPLARQYGPAILRMGVDETLAWVDLIARGDVGEAYARVLAHMPDAQLLDEWTRMNAEWAAANARNAETIALVKRAQSAILNVLLTVALASVGL